MSRRLWFRFALRCGVCGCRSKRDHGTDSSLTSSGMFLGVASFAFKTESVLFLSDAFSKEATVPRRSPRSETPVTLAASRVKDAFFTNPWGNYIINRSQNCVPDPIFNCVNNVLHFPINFFIETSFKCLNINCILIGRSNTTTFIDTKFSVNSTVIDHNNFLSAFRSLTDDSIPMKVIYLALERFVLLPFYQVETIFALTNDLPL